MDNPKKERFFFIFLYKHFEICSKMCTFVAKVGMKMCKSTIKVNVKT